MGILRRLIGWLVVLPAAVAVVALAVSNRGSVRVAWNPLEAGSPDHGIVMPLFVLGFVFFLLGAIAGGFVVWNAQRRFRRAAREGRQEVRSLKSEVDRLKQASGSPALPGAR